MAMKIYKSGTITDPTYKIGAICQRCGCIFEYDTIHRHDNYYEEDVCSVCPDCGTVVYPCSTYEEFLEEISNNENNA